MKKIINIIVVTLLLVTFIPNAVDAKTYKQPKESFGGFYRCDKDWCSWTLDLSIYSSFDSGNEVGNGQLYGVGEEEGVVVDGIYHHGSFVEKTYSGTVYKISNGEKYKLKAGKKWIKFKLLQNGKIKVYDTNIKVNGLSKPTGTYNVEKRYYS